MGKIIEMFNVETAKEQNIFGRRLAEARKQCGLQQRDLLAALRKYGITLQKNAVSNWECGIAIPNVYQARALCLALDMDLIGIENEKQNEESFLLPLNAKGVQKVKEYASDLIASGNYTKASLPKHIWKTDVKLYDIPVSAGTGNFIDTSEYEIISLPQNKVPDGTDYALHISGDSMEPLYHDGQYVFIKSVESLEPGEIGIFFYDGNVYIKMLDASEETVEDEFGEETAEQSLYLVSLNEKYKPIPIENEAPFRVLGKVLN